MTDPFPAPTLAAALDQLRRGECTPTDLVERCLARIDELEPQVHAWVLVDAAGARKLAAEQTREYQRGAPRGPLAGIPIGVKDIIDVAGWPTKAGSPLREHHVAECDAPVVAALRKAGAILLGKTVTTQFACFDPAPTRNPHNLEHSPGGSSSGSAAAVACGMCFAALATQTGGSITRPAAYCGIAGLKPTFGAVSTEGVVPVSPRLDHVGVVARCPEDLEIVWKAISKAGVSSQAKLPALRLLKWNAEFVPGTTRPIIDGLDRIVSLLETAGVECVFHPDPYAPPINDQTWSVHRCIMSHDAARYHASAFRDQPNYFAPGLTSLIAEGNGVAKEDYEDALFFGKSIGERFEETLNIVDAILTPATTSLAPPLSANSTGDPRWNSPFSLSGHPTVCIPVGRGPGNLPWGIQLVGAYGREIDLLKIAQWMEGVLSSESRS